MSKTLLAALALGALLWSSAASAETQTFQASLDGASETPPNSSMGTGSAKAMLDIDNKTLSWTIIYSGLTGAATMAHFHGPAPVGVAAGVVVPITGAMASPLVGQAVLTDAQIADLRAGHWYVNVHTAQYPKGEIRGQVAPAP